MGNENDRREAFLALSEKARGRWDFVFENLAPDLLSNTPTRHRDCPVHGGKNDFRFFTDYIETGGAICSCMNQGDGANGFRVLCWYHGWGFATAVKHVAELLGESYAKSSTQKAASLPPRRIAPASTHRCSSEDRAKEENRKAYLLKKWEEAHLPFSEEAEMLKKYVRFRGLDPERIPSSLRLHGGMYYTMEDGSKIGPFPVMLAPVCLEGKRLLSLHRTYLDPREGGKALVPEPKKTMSPINSDGGMIGGVVPLAPFSGQTLYITEGIENGLAILQATGVVTWAATSAALLRSVRVPEQVKYVVIWADKDAPKKNGARPGEDSAKVLAKRLRDEEAKTVRIIQPKMEIPAGNKGVDWLDVLNQFGFQAFSRPFADNSSASAA